ncbi:tigger transposable element-derived protein 1-like [Macrobrachium rosenbergii]|uniref:tigger transposable element-derived protein 1-like n=1 Tax=Macrobrachium rosenbergii TaxID=79674 RepID=UPI0034D3D619
MPKRTYITKEEKKLPGHKPMKDRLTLLLCANASGDLKIKPLLVYHSETPRVFKKHKVLKNKLNVMWKSNAKAWVTRQIFREWVSEVCAPTIKEYLEEKGLPLKALLVMDNAPAHPPDMEYELADEFSWLKVKFLPPRTTSLLQPMDQQIIANFKKLDFEGFDSPSQLGDDPEAEPLPLPDADVEEIVSVAKSMGLEVSSDDVEELVAEHNTELTTEELQELHKEQQKVLAEEVSEEEESKEVPTTGTKEIKEMLMHWEKFQEFFEKHHHDKAVVNRAIDYVDDNLVNVYRKHLKNVNSRRPCTGFFSKEENQPGPSAKNREKRNLLKSSNQTVWKEIPFQPVMLSPYLLSHPSPQIQILINAKVTVQYCTPLNESPKAIESGLFI